MALSLRLKLLILATTLAAAAIVLATWPMSGSRGRRALARHWQTRLAGMSDQQAVAAIDEIARLDEAAIEPLAAALGDEREPVASAAYFALLRLLDAWQQYRPKYAVPRVAALAEQLARHRATYPPPARRMAGQIARRLLDWPLADQGHRAPRLVVDCERVLRDAMQETAVGLTSEQVARSQLAAEVLAAEHGDTASRGVAEAGAPEACGPSSLAHVAPLPGGRVPLPELRVPSLPPLPPSETEPRRLGAPELEPSDAVVLRRPPAVPASPEPAAPAPVHPPYARQLPPPRQSTGPPEGQALSGQMPQPPASPVPAEELAWISQLHDAPPLAAAARERLRRRGYDATNLHVAEALLHPDARHRLELAEALPRLPGVDAARWLMVLATDPQPQVRLTAVSLLATTNDPTLLDFIRRLAAVETDARVQQQIERVLRPSAR